MTYKKFKILFNFGFIKDLEEYLNTLIIIILIYLRRL